MLYNESSKQSIVQFFCTSIDYIATAVENDLKMRPIRELQFQRDQHVLPLLTTLTTNTDFYNHRQIINSYQDSLGKYTEKGVRVNTKQFIQTEPNTFQNVRINFKSFAAAVKLETGVLRIIHQLVVGGIILAYLPKFSQYLSYKSSPIRSLFSAQAN